MSGLTRPLYIWLAFWACAALALASMGSVTFTVLKLDDESAHARQQADLEESVRLAMWRMDSIAVTLIGRESARPYYTYTSFYAANRAYTRMFAELLPGEVLVPSPLLTETNPQIRLHFQVEPSGTLASPRAPSGNMQDLAEGRYMIHEAIEQSRGLLRQLDGMLDREALWRALPLKSGTSAASDGSTLLAYEASRGPQASVRQASAPARVDVSSQANAYAQADASLQPNMPAQQRNDPDQQANAPYVAPNAPLDNLYAQAMRGETKQQALNSMEWQARTRTNLQAIVAQQRFDPPPSSEEVEVGSMTPLWMGGALLLARRISASGRDYVQGCWLDWPLMRQELLVGIQDLLPEGALEPLGDGDLARGARRLASLPVKFVPGEVPPGPSTGLSPIQLSLLVAWGCAFLAVGAIGVLLRGAILLSERRGAFVSAVTHELRTPLTTFRMYTEMLLAGMVPDVQKQQRYLKTLYTEANRLDHLVQNVLAYARLERTNAGGRIETVSAEELLKRIRERLEERANQAGRNLVVDLEEGVGGVEVRTDISATDRILFNLVDNACKYSREAADLRIHVLFTRAGKGLAIEVRDHGGGISKESARRLFQPFSKSAKAAAETAPGVGLGLALSRRLARKMGGDLRLAPAVGEGAAFVLTLPSV